jgi:hypothetical protein
MNTAIDSHERQGHRRRDPIQLLAGSWRLLGALLAWLTGLGHLSDQELHEAGIYVGDPR